MARNRRLPDSEDKQRHAPMLARILLVLLVVVGFGLVVLLMI